MMISDRFTKAVELAVEVHKGQLKKLTDNPYIFHPLAVASLVMQYGGDEEQAMAAVVHDTIDSISRA